MNRATHGDTSAGADGHGRGTPAGAAEAGQECHRGHQADDPGIPGRGLDRDEPGGHRVDGNDPCLQPAQPAETAHDPGGMTVVIGGFAAAAGAGSMATGVVDVVAQDGPGVCISRGVADFDAYGYGQPGQASAVTDAYLQVSGADLVLRWACESSGVADGQAWSHSEIDYLAIDIGAWSPSQPIVIDVDQPMQLQPASLAAGAGFAAAAASVEAYGEDVLSLTSTYAFTNGDLSFVHAMALASL